MKITARIFSLVLAVMMLLSVVACANTEDPVTTTGGENTKGGNEVASTTGANNGGSEEVTTEGNYDANGYIKDNLDPNLNFGNKEFNILAWEHTLPEFDIEAETGNIVENAIFVRNANTEERLGVQLNFTVIKGNSSAFRDFCKEVDNTIQSNTDSYDAIGCYLRSAGVLTLQHHLVNMLEVDHLDFSMPWWSDSLLELNTINDNLYFISGDIASTLIYQMMFMIYNNDLGEDIGLTNPQQLALDNKWTLDTMFTMAKDVYTDLDNDTEKSEGDRYGLFSYAHPNLDIFYMGSDLHYMAPNADGDLVVLEDIMSDKSLSIIDRLIDIYGSNDGWFSTKLSSTDIFAQGNSLFYNITGQILAQNLRNTDMDYSILPAPKYDEAQENYRTAVAFTHTMYCIPINAKNTEMSGAVLECMASEAYRNVTPALFESSFKYQYSKNPNDTLLFEIIRDNVVFDICRPFFDSMGGDSDSPVRVWRNQIVNGNNSIASASAIYKRAWTRYLKTISEELKG